MKSAALCAMLLLATIQAAASALVEVGKFSAMEAGKPLADGWQPLNFPRIARHTTYELVADNGTVVVKASADASASGLVRHLAIDPARFPVIRWRWKVSNLLAKADPRSKEGDDYPARIYITFAYDPALLGPLESFQYRAARVLYGEYPPLRAINYVRDSRTPAGSVLPNAYSARNMMIVAESGTAHLGEWRELERNLAEDYRLAFGAEAPMISGVAIMTDTDNTGEKATAYYGDIVFKGAEP